MFVMLWYYFWLFSDVNEAVRLSQIAEGGVSEECTNVMVGQASSVEGVNNVDDSKKKQTKKAREFKIPEKEETIEQFSKKQFAPQSKHKIMWVVNLYSDWRRNRIAVPGVCYQIVQANLEMLYTFTQGDLCYSLSRFIREVKKLDGSDYPPNTVRDLVLMIQIYLHENSIYWKLLDNPEFVMLRNVLDNAMKERHGQGLGVHRSSDIITLDNKELMFNKGVLGDEFPLQLLGTVIYMVGMRCALRGGNEHNNLRRPGFQSQFMFERDQHGIERLVYREDTLQKTNWGGLQCKGRNKIVYVYPASTIRRCPVYFLKKYIGLMPDSKCCKKLYLRCKKYPTPATWYCDQPYGVNKIKATVKEICKEAGIEGHFTNHSLRATCATPSLL